MDRPPPPGRFVTVHGNQWHVEEYGTHGPALVLFHGYLGSAANWRTLGPLLAPHLRVYAVDILGAGYSDRPTGVPYTLPWLADQVPALCAALDLDRPFLGGHSFGAALALHAAARHPDRTAGLVLVAPLVYRQQPPPGLRFAQRHPGIAGRFFASRLGRRVIPHLVRRVAYRGETHKKSVRVDRMLGHLDAPGGWLAATRMGLVAVAGAPDVGELARIRQPVLVTWGRHDPVHDPGLAARLERDLPGPTHVVLFGHAAHNAHEEAATELAQAIVKFVDAPLPTPEA